MNSAPSFLRHPTRDCEFCEVRQETGASGAPAGETTLCAAHAEIQRTARWVESKEVARWVRRALREAFPERPSCFFSVRSDHGAVDVRWYGGPAAAHVREVVCGFAGISFDGMIDLEFQLPYYEVDGEAVRSRAYVLAFGLERER